MAAAYSLQNEEPALGQVDILARSGGPWTAHSGAKEKHEEERAEEKNRQVLTTTSILCAAWGRSVECKGV